MADDININIGANPAGVEAGSRRAKVALKGVADGGKDLDAALRRLRSAIDPTFVAMEKYNKTHKENLDLLRAGLVTRREYNQAMKVAKQALAEETAAIERNSAAGRAAAAEKRRLELESRQASKAAAQEEARIAREAEAEKRRIAREAAAEKKRLDAESRAAAREAAAAAKTAAREAAQAERQAKREAAQEARQAAEDAKRAAREKTAAERQAARESAEAEKNAKRQMREAAREAARVAAQAAKDRAKAEREATAASREAADEAARLAKAERQAAQAADDLRSSIDPAYASQQRYNETMRRATQLLMMNKLQQGEWTAIQKQAKAQMDVNTRSLGQQNAMYVQLGYQAQDVTASLASGINPLVILAQQGGQTAAALSTMGGTAGKVAAFFAGPWGAAIIGATLLLGYLWEANKEAESTTKDVMNAEDRRRMSVKELTEALKDYVRQQREANETTREGAIAQAAGAQGAVSDVMAKMAKAQADLTAAQQAFDAAVSSGNAGSALMGLSLNLMLAQRKVDQLKDAYKSAQEAAGEAAAAYTQTTVEMTELERREQDERTAALGKFRREWAAAGTDAAKQIKAQTTYQQDLTRIQTHYNKLKEEETEARRKNAREARAEGDAIWKSREAAIKTAGLELRKAGYNVGENNQFGGVKGNHPGMGNAAHGKFAIDVNIPGAGTEAYNNVTKRRMDEMVKAYQARGFRVLWNGKVYSPYGQGASYDIPAGQNQHKDHVHIESSKAQVGQSSGSSVANKMIGDAKRIAEEEKRIAEEAMKDRIAEFEFRKELNQDDLAEVLRIQGEKITAIKAFYGAESKEALDAQREKVRIERQYSRELVEIRRSEIEQKLKMAEAAAATEEELASIARGGKSENIDFNASNGLISERQAIVQKAQLLDEEFQMQQRHEQRMYELKRQSILDQLALEGLTAKQKRELNEQLETAEIQHNQRMEIAQAQYARNIQQVQNQAAQVSMSRWKEVGSVLSSSLTSSFQGLWTRTMTLQQAFIGMADNLVYKFVDMGAKMFEDWFMRQVGMTTVQQAQDGLRTTSTTMSTAAQTAAVASGQATQTGVKAAAAATETGINTATTTAKVAAEAIKTGAAVTGAAAQTSAAAVAGTTEIGTNAAVAAAGAYKSTVVIPFIGPVAAPAAAALALAAVLGFGALISSSGGQGEVPMDGQLSMLHKKETVLPAWIAEPMRQMFVSPRSSNGLMSAAAAAGGTARDAVNQSQSANFYYQPKHTNMGAGLDELLRKDGRALRRWFKNEVRNGGIKF